MHTRMRGLIEVGIMYILYVTAICERMIERGVESCVQLEAVDTEDRDGPILGNAQKRALQPPHSVSLDMDYMG